MRRGGEKPGGAEFKERALAQMAGDPVERLRWMVMGRLGILPGSREERRLRGRALLRWGLHLVLDARAAAAPPSGKEEEAGPWQNPAFDPARFEELMRG